MAEQAVKDLLISWLNDAYAMEQQLVSVLRHHADDVKDNPAIQRRIEQHIEETRQHAARDEQCIRELGGSVSAIKSSLSSLLGTIQGMSTGLFADAGVKDALSDYSAEQFEVASYRALIAAAEEAGKPNVALLCRQNLREDEDMAQFLSQHLPGVVRRTMEKRAVGAR